MSPVLKLVIIGCVLVISAGAFGYYFGRVLGGDGFAGVFTAGLIFGALQLVGILAISSKNILSGLALGEIIAFSIFSFPKSGFILYGVIAFSALILIFAILRGRHTGGISLSPSVNRVAALVLPSAASAFALIMTFIYVSGFIGRDFTLPKESVESLLHPLEAPLRGFIPGFSLDMSVRSATRALLESRAPGEIRALPRDVKDQLLQESEGQVIQTISGALKIAVSPQESVLSVLHRALNAQVIKIPANLQTPILIAFGFLVFLSIKGLALILRYPIAWLGFGLYKLLLAVGFLKIIEEDIKRQAVVL